MRRQRGFSLIELLVYLGLMLVVLGFSFQVFSTALDIFRKGGSRADDLRGVQLFAERFRDDVRNATGFPGSAGRFTASSSVLILGEGAETRVYVFAEVPTARRKEGILRRFTLRDGATAKSDSWTFDRAVFSADAASGAVTARVVSQAKRQGSPAREITFTARKRNAD